MSGLKQAFGWITGSTAREKYQGGIDGIVDSSEKRINKQEEEYRGMYQNDYYGDTLARADVSHILKRQRDAAEKQNLINSNVAAVTGATNDALISQKQQMSDSESDAIAAAVAQGSVVKDRAKSIYADQMSRIEQQRGNLDNLKMKQMEEQYKSEIAQRDAVMKGIKAVGGAALKMFPPTSAASALTSLI